MCLETKGWERTLHFWWEKANMIGTWNSKEKVTREGGRSESEVSFVSQGKEPDLILKAL